MSTPSASAPSRRAAQAGRRLAASVLDHDLLRHPVRELLDIGDHDLERDPERARISRRRGEADARISVEVEVRNQSAISRSADSSESEPWTRLKVTSTAKSPRIEPAAASSGLVAPITCRAAATASGPSSTAATSGPR